MPKTRPPYPPEFRAEAVAMVRSGRPVPEVAEALGVSQQSLRNWVNQTQRDRRERDDGLTSAEREELRALRGENARLKQERDLLKRAVMAGGAGHPRAMKTVMMRGVLLV